MMLTNIVARFVLWRARRRRRCQSAKQPVSPVHWTSSLNAYGTKHDRCFSNAFNAKLPSLSQARALALVGVYSLSPAKCFVRAPCVRQAKFSSRRRYHSLSLTLTLALMATIGWKGGGWIFCFCVECVLLRVCGLMEVSLEVYAHADWRHNPPTREGTPNTPRDTDVSQTMLPNVHGAPFYYNRIAATYYNYCDYDAKDYAYSCRKCVILFSR